MADPDLLFSVRNNYYLGSYQHAISEASDLESLVEQEKIERDLFVYRSYIELGSYEVHNSIISISCNEAPPPPSPVPTPLHSSLHTHTLGAGFNWEHMHIRFTY